jgi:hypothetical protein
MQYLLPSSQRRRGRPGVHLQKRLQTRLFGCGLNLLLLGRLQGLKVCVK